MNIIFFPKIYTSLNIEYKPHMNNQVIDTDSGEPLVLSLYCHSFLLCYPLVSSLQSYNREQGNRSIRRRPKKL